MSGKKLNTLLRNMSESEVKTLHDLLFRRKYDKDGKLIETKPKRKTLPYFPSKDDKPKRRTLPYFPSKDKVKRRQLMNKGGLNKRRK